DRLEPLVRDRLTALDRDPVRAGIDTRLRALNSGELVPETLAQAGLELVLVQLAALIAEMLVDRRKLAVAPARLLDERSFDALALPAEELTCSFGVHALTLPMLAIDKRGLVLARSEEHTLNSSHQIN